MLNKRYLLEARATFNHSRIAAILGKRMRNQKQTGFTIVELLIVIVVIGILAAVTVAAYYGVSNRASDAKRRSDATAIVKMISLYAIDHDGDTFGVGSGCGADGNGNGWWESNEAKYPKSTRQCLVDAGYTQAASINDPSGCSGGGGPTCVGKPRYMIVHCQLSGQPKAYVLMQLESEPANTTFTDALCDDGTSPGFVSIKSWDTSYGINYSVPIQ